MPRRIILCAFLALLSLPLGAKELIIPIAAVAQGVNGTFFRTDVRIFNPSYTGSIVVQLQFLPLNNDNSDAPVGQLGVGQRQMVVLNNIVADFFGAGGLGAIRFQSGEDLVVTSRTYTDRATPAPPGTLGQFVPALESSQALTRGVVLQLSNNTDLSAGYRTNFGLMNPNATEVTARVEVRRADGTLVKAGSVTIPPRSVEQGGIPGFAFENGYLSFTSPLPVFGYASVVDNQSGDQIFVAAQQDSGNPPLEARTVTVHVGPGLVFSPASVTINAGDTVEWRSDDAVMPHTTTSDRGSGAEVWDSGTLAWQSAFSHRFTTAGDWEYYCRFHSTPNGNIMNGVVHVLAAGAGR